MENFTKNSFANLSLKFIDYFLKFIEALIIASILFWLSIIVPPYFGKYTDGSEYWGYFNWTLLPIILGYFFFTLNKSFSKKKRFFRILIVSAIYLISLLLILS